MNWVVAGLYNFGGKWLVVAVPTALGLYSLALSIRAYRTRQDPG